MFRTLRAARISYGYTLDEAAERLGVSVATYNQFENDSSLIPVKTIRKLRGLYGIPLELFSSALKLNALIIN